MWGWGGRLMIAYSGRLGEIAIFSRFLDCPNFGVERDGAVGEIDVPAVFVFIHEHDNLRIARVQVNRISRVDTPGPDLGETPGAPVHLEK